MKLTETATLFFALLVSSLATAQSFTGKNTKSADPLKELGITIVQSDTETTINVSGIEELIEDSETRFKYTPKYLDCSNCNEHSLEVVYEIVGEYTFGGHSGSKTFSLRYSPTIESRNVRSLQMIERNGENLIAAESFKRTITKGTTLYIKLIEVRGYVVNNSIRTDKKFYRLGKLFKF